MTSSFLTQACAREVGSHGEPRAVKNRSRRHLQQRVALRTSPLQSLLLRAHEDCAAFFSSVAF
ncbi:MAG: hypothetical protein SGPRY_014687 [Prymnesium sp.]